MIRDLIKEEYYIDPETISKILIKEKSKSVKVFMGDCSGKASEIDWIFEKDESGIEKIEKVISVFERVKELLKNKK